MISRFPRAATIVVALAATATAGWLAMNFFGDHSSLIVSPEALDFGEMVVGETRSGVVVVTNTGDEPITVDGVELGAPFSSGGPFALQPGGSQAVMIEMIPTASGAVKTEAVFHTGDIAHRVTLEGSAVLPPKISVEPLALRFGDVAIGSVAQTEISVTNHGEVPLEIGSVAVGQGFRVASPELEVAPGETRGLTIEFAPRVPGAIQFPLSISSNDPERQEVGVFAEGRGVHGGPEPVLDVQPGSLDFGSVPVGAALDQWLTLVNLGEDELMLSTLRATGSFSVPSRSRRIEAGGTLKLPVSFHPSASGSTAHRLAIYSNDPQMPVRHVDLNGEGVIGERALQVANRPGLRFARESELPVDSRAIEFVEKEAQALGIAAPTLATGGPGAPPLDPTELADSDTSTGDSEGPLDPGPPVHTLGEGEIKLGSYSARIEDFHANEIDFDPATRRVSLSIEPPTVDAAVGEYFQFGDVTLNGSFDEFGEGSFPVTLTMLDRNGNIFEIETTYTTGTAVALTNGSQIARTGELLSNGSATLVALHTFENGPFAGAPFYSTLQLRFDDDGSR